MKTVMLPDTLQSFDYYVSKLPLYLRSSYGFIDQFRIWYDILMGDFTKCGIVPSGQNMLDVLNIFSKDYLQKLAVLKTQDSETSDILDKLSALVGVKRRFSVTYTNDEEQTVLKQLSLNDYELALLIKAQIIRQYCEGTFAQLIEFYTEAGLYIIPVTADIPATCYIFLQRADDSEYQYSDNIEAMFYAGLLDVESMGITYQRSIIDFDNILIWNSNVRWDVGEWSR